MECPRCKERPDSATKLRLFADSGGYCQNPKCNEPLFRDFDAGMIHLAEMAHIISASDTGPRADTATNTNAKGSYSNFILLCPTCHTVIDKTEDQYPKATILLWKQTHKERISALFGLHQYTTRQEAREALSPFLRENRTIFDIYGPMTPERFNPESTLPKQWQMKLLTRILPNNRKMLVLCDCNRAIMSQHELDTVELFRQHAHDLEVRHLDSQDICGIPFPQDMCTLFTEVS